jgi:hypothetical protein
MPRFARLVCSILVAGSLLAPASAHAFVEPNFGWGPLGSNGGGPGISAVGQYTGSAWFAVRFSVPATTHVSFSVTADLANSQSAGLAAWVTRGSGVIGGAETIVYRDPLSNVVYVNGAGTRMLDRSSGGGAASGVVEQAYDLEPGTYRGVALAAADGTVSGSVKIESTGHVDVLATSAGNQVFLADERAFAGVANAYVQPAPHVRGEAMANASFTTTAQRSLFGWFGAVNQPGAQLHYDGADGRHDGLPIYTFAGAPAGGYTMTVDAAAGAAGAATMAFGADVLLP